MSHKQVLFDILRDLEPLEGYLKYMEGVPKTTQVQKVTLNQAGVER